MQSTNLARTALWMEWIAQRAESFFDSATRARYRLIGLGVCREALRSRLDERPLEPDPADTGVGKAWMTERSRLRPKPLPGRQEAAFQMPSQNAQRHQKITIKLNDEAYVIEGDARLTALIDALKMKPTRIAVELNREVVPKADYASIVLREGDELELINFVGGG
jgi:sulfur carrier protein